MLLHTKAKDLGRPELTYMVLLCHLLLQRTWLMSSKITLQFLIAVWALTSMSIFQGYQKSRRTIRTHFCAESVFLLFVFKQLYQKSSTRFCLHLIGQDLVMAIISCKTHWKWPCNRTDASTSQTMQKIAGKHQKLKEERNNSLHLESL